MRGSQIVSQGPPRHISLHVMITPTSIVPLQGSYLTFLPQDDGGGGADPAAEEVAAAIQGDLKALLAATDATFAAAIGDASLRACLDSYLQHSR